MLIVSRVRPLATVIVCTAGRPSLDTTLRALAGGCLDHVSEVLVVDNTGGGLAVDARVAAALPLRIVDGSPVLSVARDKGIAEATTDVVLFTDDDCVPDPDWAERAVAHLAASPSTAAAFGHVRPSPRDGFLVREAVIPDVGTAAWGEVPATGDWCPAISAPSWATGPARATTVPWACVGSSNSLFLRRSEMLPGRPVFLPGLGAGTAAPSGEDTELGYALLRAGRRVDHAGDARAVHDRWVPPDEALALTHAYFVGNVAALGEHVLRGDERARLLLDRYVEHVRSLRVAAGLPDLLDWAYGSGPPHAALAGLA